MEMAFYVVVHHRRAAQTWQNTWIDDDRLRAINTTTEIARRCSLARNRGERVFVHRCGWDGGSPRICCSALVEEAGETGKDGWVTFHDQQVLSATPTVRPLKGQNSYEASEP